MDVETKTNVSPQPRATHTLRKSSLGTGDAIAQSVALLALVMGTALSTSLAASSAGAAAPLAYLVVGVASLCLAYVIIRFTRRSASSGSVYTYIAQGLGPQVGFVGGWMYAGAFVLGISFVLAIASSFLSSLFANFHLTVDWFPIFTVLLVLLFLFAFFDVRISTRIQLVLAGIGVLSVLVLAVIILVHGGAGGLSLTPFSPGALTGGFSGLFFAAVFSFTSFIGFEAAAVLGEETANPRFTIPRAILAAIIVGVVYYVFVTYSMSIGYGTNHAAIWAQDAAPLDTLANRYSNAGLATFIDLMVALDAFVAALAGLNLTSRILFSMGRDRGIPPVFGWTHVRFKSPWVGILFSLVITFLLGVTLGRSLGVFNFFGFMATIGSLGILLAYILVALSWIVFAIRLFRRERNTRSIVFDVLLPLIAIVVCGATIYSSIIPVPPAPLNQAPYIVGGWLVLGIILMVVLWLTAPHKVSQFGKHLADE
ncbi:MAG TPA: APC family permease [Ktedonobacteraceae bacterium]|nr:APC family permease [Ktedonobacteraceae bacterium]